MASTAEHAAVPITAAPAKDQLVEHDGKTFKTVQEGKAYILVPPNARTSVDPQAKSKADDGTQVQNVFYNPIQQFNRDLSVLAIKAFGEDLCDKKRKRHDQFSEKRQRKKQKRKRTDQDEETSGAKLRRTAGVAPVNGPNGANTEQDRSGASAAAEEGAIDPATTEDGGVVLVQSDSSTDGHARGRSALQDENVQTNGTHEETAQDQQDTQSNTRQQWQPRFRILDALSATGLRALRYASEIPFVTSVVANDRDANAVKSIDLNVQHNNLSSSIVTITGDAIGHMYNVAFPSPQSHGPQHISGKYDVIDLDPYGTAAPFIDAALQALDDGGLLCVTCTDSGVFASCGYSEKTFALYGGMPIKGNHSHEGGLRLILHSVATSAAKNGIAIEPLLSLSIDFYVRIFIRVRKSAADVKFLAGKTMIVYECDHGCGAWTNQFIGRHTRQKNAVNLNDSQNWKFSIAQGPASDAQCEHCGSKTHVAGPMWGGPLHNPVFVEKILEALKEVDEELYATKARLEGMLDTALDELSVNADSMDYRQPDSNDIIPPVPPPALDHFPFFFIPSALCKVIKASAPPENLVKGALRHSGYRVTRSHCKPGSIKTDAPWSTIWEVMREWVRQKSPIKESALKEGQAGWKIMQGMRKDDGATAETNGTNSDTPEITTESTNGDAIVREKPTDPKRMKVVFDEKLGRDKPGRRLVRYQQNPRENWGPMARARGSG